MRVFQREIFGPVVSVATFKTDEEALRIANDTLYGLGAGVWTRDGTRAYRMGRAIQAGRVWTNCYHAYPRTRRSAATNARALARDAPHDAGSLPADQESAGQLFGEEARLFLTAVKAGTGAGAHPCPIIIRQEKHHGKDDEGRRRARVRPAPDHR